MATNGIQHLWLLEIRRKIQASNELWHKILGTINTPEKFEQHRLELAESVWCDESDQLTRVPRLS